MPGGLLESDPVGSNRVGRLRQTDSRVKSNGDATVWRHLGSPELVDNGDGTHSLAAEPSLVGSDAKPAWIYVFDLEVSDKYSPNRIRLWRVIATDASSIAYYALEVAPDAALEQNGSVDAIRENIRSRLAKCLSLDL